MDKRLDRFCEKIGYGFKQKDLLRQALAYGCSQHRSLALLGDALWTEYVLYTLHCNSDFLGARSLHFLKTALINNHFLGERAKSFGILDFVISSQPSKLYNRQLACVFEAVVGAVRLDSRDYEEACKVASSIIQLDRLFSFSAQPISLVTHQGVVVSEETERPFEVTLVDLEESDSEYCEEVDPDVGEGVIKAIVEVMVSADEPKSPSQLPKITFIKHGEPLPDSLRHVPDRSPVSNQTPVGPSQPFLNFGLAESGSRRNGHNGHRRLGSRNEDVIPVMTIEECEELNAMRNPEYRLKRLVREKFDRDVDFLREDNRRQVMVRVVAGKRVLGTGSGKKPADAKQAAISNALKNLTEV